MCAMGASPVRGPSRQPLTLLSAWLAVLAVLLGLSVGLAVFVYLAWGACGAGWVVVGCGLVVRRGGRGPGRVRMDPLERRIGSYL